jgi:predicted RecA/RadA family phage recombinase
MVNKLQDGKSINVVLSANVGSGELYPFGDRVGVTTTAAVAGTSLAIQVQGVYEVPKVTGANSGFPIGTALYYDATAHKVTETSNSGANKLAGHAWRLAGDNDATCALRLIG